MFKSLVLKSMTLIALLGSNSVFSKEVNIKTLRVDIMTKYGVLLTEIHYDKVDERKAVEVKRYIKEDLSKVVEYFKYVPQEIVHINLDPYKKISNGNAVTFPYNIINLNLLPPSQSSHLMGIDNWLQGVLVHEFIHIVHLDKTRGLWNVGRKIFGTISKIPVGVVPSWFTEGIATWGESTFINGGRLNHEMYNKDYLIYFLRNENCSTVDCLDTPKGYPGGQLSYWAGSHFMKYLEDKRLGTIRCLVHFNSSKIPFLLNNVFDQCTGKNVEENFDDFKTFIISNIPPESKEESRWGEAITNSFGVDVYQKGVVFDGRQLFKVEHDRYHEAVASYDREDNIAMTVKSYPFPISEITQTFTEGNISQDGDKYLIASFLDDPNFRKTSKSWFLIDALTLDLEKKLPFKNDPQYVFYIENHQFLTASFSDNTWKLEVVEMSRDFTKVVKEEIIRSFDQSFHLKKLALKGNKLLLIYNRYESNVVNFLNLNDIKKFNYSAQTVYLTKNTLDVVLFDEKLLIFKDDNNNKLIKEEKGNYKLYDYINNSLSAVSQIYVGENSLISLENKMKSRKMTREDFYKEIDKNTTFKENLVIKDLSIGMGTPYLLEQKSENYPRLTHFIPHYWFLLASNEDNTSSVGVFTTINDPMLYTTMDLGIESYPSENKIGGNASLTHKFQSPSDLLTFNSTFEKDFFKSKSTDTLNSNQKLSFSLSYEIQDKKWAYTPIVATSFEKTNDFVSSNNVNKQTVGLNVAYSAMVYHETLKDFNFYLAFDRNDIKDKKEFYGLKTKFTSYFRATNAFHVGVNGSYARNFKSDFDRGVIFGGGITNYMENRFHEFYGIPYSDAYGNEIATFRVYGDFKVWDIYRGVGMLPLFLREIHLIFGRDMMLADRIIADEKYLLRDKIISSIFVGPKFKGKAFYYLPFDLDIIFSHVSQSDIDSYTAVNANIKVSF